ncbi:MULTISPECIES: tRNA uridine-5-carboxymethylaminomethyl(34) synthesis GTPase MnmE [unclassified Sphingomonas]|jgi:tRNA modification GTPase|uniref:tRNA uridine-5-carboxymethylaminomethyl(34) synthesis GTPase MnmE n=1 Tax=unclassified Sphingomonas TaxID=196159 RepID=UPI000E109BAB|nr:MULTISPECIES: tRNA uridine-5-carboxymethylaminomethyl(34) synthesis GTPase MnmE [unclassified Sphingomonas]AXJ95273.1 tRNA uridine-5-carboxymethylaminomethyl(34) synthesis GTPase MnmE [Sphingomonas sp. FARSPH]
MTIFALSSGAAPAGIGVIRISGPAAFTAVMRLAGSLPPPREARVRALRDEDGALIDRALVLLFPGLASATGEDLAELHCHGGRAVIAALLQALGRQPGLRPAEAGEFTRRALGNGRIDLAEARGLADLLSADTERQRVAALAAAEGVISRMVHGWVDRLSMLAAQVEAQLDFADEDDVAAHGAALADVRKAMVALAAEWTAILAEPPVERVRDGLSVVLAGPPNSGKSTLINMLSQRDVAIVSPIAGTTRDRIEAAVVRDGLSYILTDTAGLTDSDDAIERIGVGLAGEAIARADILLWLGEGEPPRADAIRIHPRADAPGRQPPAADREIAVAQSDAASVAALWRLIAARAETLVPRSDMLALRADERRAVQVARDAIADPAEDALLVAEDLRIATRALGTILGIDATEAMLDTLFGRFCIGK